MRTTIIDDGHSCLEFPRVHLRGFRTLKPMCKSVSESEWNHFLTSFSMLDYYSSFIIAMFEYLILLLIDNSNIAKWLLIFRHSSSKITMLFKWVIMLVLELSECSNLRQYGEIRIANNLKETIRVIMSPAISWNYHERRTNVTLQRNPFKAVGGTHIL